jgi:hypothetical protein
VYIYIWFYSQFFGPWQLFTFSNLYAVGRTPWMGDQPVARPLATQRTTQTQNKRKHIHTSSGIRTHDPSGRVSEDSSCLISRGHCDRQLRSKWGTITSFSWIPRKTTINVSQVSQYPDRNSNQAAFSITATSALSIINN